MYWKVLLGSLATVTYVGSTLAMAQTNDASPGIRTHLGRKSGNENTTNSLTGSNAKPVSNAKTTSGIRTHLGRKNGNENTTNSLSGVNGDR